MVGSSSTAVVFQTSIEPCSGATCCAGVRCSGQSHSEWHTIDCRHVTLLKIIEHQHLSYNLVYSLSTKIVGARLLLTIRPCATMRSPEPKLLAARLLLTIRPCATMLPPKPKLVGARLLPATRPSANVVYAWTTPSVAAMTVSQQASTHSVRVHVWTAR